MHLERYRYPPEVSSASMDVRRAVNISQENNTSTTGRPLLSVSEDAVAHLHQTNSHVDLSFIPASSSSSQCAAKLSMACSVDIPAFRSTEASDDDATSQPHSHERHITNSQPVVASDQGEAVLHAAPPQHPTTDKRPNDCQSPQQASKRARTNPSAASDLPLQAANRSEAEPSVHGEQPVWKEQLCPSVGNSHARLSRVNALATCSLRTASGGEQQRHCIVCAAGTLALPTSLAHAQQPAIEQSQCTVELVPCTMVWAVPLLDATSSKDRMHGSGSGAEGEQHGAMTHEVHASCLLVDNDEAASLHAETSPAQTTGVQSVVMQPVGEGAFRLEQSHATQSSGPVKNRFSPHRLMYST